MSSIIHRLQEFRTGLRPRIKEWRFMLKRIRESNLALLGIVILLAFAGMAIFAPVLAPKPIAPYYTPNPDPFTIPQDHEINVLTPNPTPPTLRHIFGTTDSAYDLYYACIWGTITAFRIGVLVVAVSLIIGVLIGTLAAYYGGLLDEALMRFTDIIIAFPGLILAMALVIAFPTVVPIAISSTAVAIFLILTFVVVAVRPSRKLMAIMLGALTVSLLSLLYFPVVLNLGMTKLDKVLVAITLVGWPGYTRVIRGEILRVKNEDYVEAAKASGSSDVGVITRHILPNSIYPLLIVATLDIGSTVLTAAAMSFLGIGAEADFADWGQIIQKSQGWISSGSTLLANFHTFFIPGLFITLFVMGWNLLGDALRDVLDPMLRRR